MSKRKTKPTLADKAFTAPNVDTLGDLKLEPWTPDRIIKAQELGQIYPNLGTEGNAQFKKTSVYPGAIRDVILFVYLSQLSANDIDEATWVNAKAFGAKRGLHNADGAAFWQAYAKFIETQNQIAVSIAVPKGASVESEEESADSGPKD